MTIHKAGYSLLLKLGAALCALNAAVFYLWGIHVAGWCIGVSAVFYLLVLNFFRFPHRVIVLDEHTILAPADGKIVVIEETEEPEYFHDRRLQVSIFMNIFNVHINWFPVNGVVRYFQYHKGNFAAAYLPKSSTENERTSIVIECGSGQKILMRQIAGAMAKRIVSTPLWAGKRGRTGMRDSSNSARAWTCSCRWTRIYAWRWAKRRRGRRRLSEHSIKNHVYTINSKSCHHACFVGDETER